GEELEEGLAAVAVVGVLPAQLLGEQLGEAHLDGEEAGRRELRDEAAARVAAQELPRVRVRGVGDVPRPAFHRGGHVRANLRPALLGDAERRADVAEPAVERARGVAHYRSGELPP